MFPFLSPSRRCFSLSFLSLSEVNSLSMINPSYLFCNISYNYPIDTFCRFQGSLKSHRSCGMRKYYPQANSIFVAIESDYRSFGSVIFRSERACMIKEPGCFLIHYKPEKRGLCEVILESYMSVANTFCSAPCFYIRRPRYPVDIDSACRLKDVLKLLPPADGDNMIRS